MLIMKIKQLFIKTFKTKLCAITKWFQIDESPKNLNKPALCVNSVGFLECMKNGISEIQIKRQKQHQKDYQPSQTDFERFSF